MLTVTTHQPQAIDFIPVEPTPVPNVKHKVAVRHCSGRGRLKLDIDTFTEAFWEVLEACNTELQQLGLADQWRYDSSELLTPVNPDSF